MKQNPTTPAPPTETLIINLEDSNVAFVSATLAQTSLALFKFSDYHKSKKIFRRIGVKITFDWND